MGVSVGLVAQLIEKIAPKSWAEDWDNAGLLVGSGSSVVERILITLDGTSEVVEEAKDRGAQLIVAHHPIMFRPLKNLRNDNLAARVPLSLLRHQIAYYAAHTNLDQSSFSSSQTLGKMIGLQKMEIMERTDHQNSGCSLESPRGYGVIGYLSRQEKLGLFWDRFLTLLGQSGVYAQSYELAGIRLAGQPEKEIRKIAILNGSGGSFVGKALFKGADLIITGDVDHHTVLDALEGGMAVGDLGHFLSEAPMLRTLHDYLSTQKSLQGIEILITSRNRTPWLV